VKKLWVVFATLASGWLSSGCGDAGGGTADAAPPDGPYLSALGVTISSVAVPLVPAFVPSVYDYYVRCGAGANAISISMTASPGAESALLQPSPSASKPQQIVSVSVNENQALVAAVKAVTPAMTAKTQSKWVTREYWIRCLPHDFPQLQMSLHPEVGTAPLGYYLLGDRQMFAGAGGYAMVLDHNGVPVWYAKQAQDLGVINVDSLVSGAISFIGSSSLNLPYEIHQLSPLMTTRAIPKNTVLDSHELRLLSNGHFLVLSNPIKTDVDLKGLSLPLPNGTTQTFGAKSDILDCNMVEFTQAGEVVWTWVGSDHLDALQETTLPSVSAVTGPGGAPTVDVFHCNSIDVDPASGNLLVSARNMDSVFYVERSSGTIEWKMGGTTYSKTHPTYVSVADAFYRQHDARLQSWTATCKGGSGQVSMFDDQTSAPGPARGVVYDVTVAAPGCASGGNGAASRATVSWQYPGTTSASATGSFRISPDGSRVIGWGFGFTPNLAFTETDAQGDDLLDFYYTDNNSSYRVVKVPLTALDLDVMRSTAGHL
jgi:hypothetical protein